MNGALSSTILSKLLPLLQIELNAFQLRPAELAVQLCQFRLAELLLTTGTLRVLRLDFQGPWVAVTYDVGDEYDWKSETSRFYASPLSLLIENDSLDHVRAMKAAGILRPNSVFRSWIDLLIRNQIYSITLIYAGFVIAFMMSWIGNPYSRERLRNACGHSLTQPILTLQKVGELFLLNFLGLYYTITFLMQLTVSVTSVKYLQVTQCLISNIRDERHFLTEILIGLCFVVCYVLWIAVIAIPSAFCNKELLHTLICFIMNMILLYHVLYYSVFEKFVGGFLGGFFIILNQFMVFLFFYLFITVVFSSSFQNAYLNSVTYRNVSRFPEKDIMFSDFVNSAYTAFRISLNIIDLSRDTTDSGMMMIHTLFVVTLTIMFFNYIIGVVSARLGMISEIREEKLLLDTTRLVYRVIRSRYITRKTFRFFKKTISDTKNLEIVVLFPLNDVL